MPKLDIKKKGGINYGNGFVIIDPNVNYFDTKPELFYGFYVNLVKILESANVKELNLGINDIIILFENTNYQFIYLIKISNKFGIFYLSIQFNTCHQFGSIHIVYNYNNDDTTLDYGKEGWNDKYKFTISQFHLINFEDNELKSKIREIIIDHGLSHPRSDDNDTNATKKVCV